MNKIKISNQRLWELECDEIFISEWIYNNVGVGNYVEHFGTTNLPYRSFSFKNEEDAVMFTLKFL